MNTEITNTSAEAYYAFESREQRQARYAMCRRMPELLRTGVYHLERASFRFWRAKRMASARQHRADVCGYDRTLEARVVAEHRKWTRAALAHATVVMAVLGLAGKQTKNSRLAVCATTETRA